MPASLVNRHSHVNVWKFKRFVGEGFATAVTARWLEGPPQGAIPPNHPVKDAALDRPARCRMKDVDGGMESIGHGQRLWGTAWELGGLHAGGCQFLAWASRRA